MSKRLAKKRALKEIDSAFNGVTLENGVSLHETLEIDDHRKVLPTSKSREKDETLDWRKLINSPYLYEFCWNGGVHFFDGKGYRFHLPAYLTACIRNNMLGDIASIVITSLTKPSKHRVNDFKLFSNGQRNAVFNAVLYLHKFDIIPLEEDELTGLHKYWSKK